MTTHTVTKNGVFYITDEINTFWQGQIHTFVNTEII